MEPQSRACQNKLYRTDATRTYKRQSGNYLWFHHFSLYAKVYTFISSIVKQHSASELKAAEDGWLVCSPVGRLVV